MKEAVMVRTQLLLDQQAFGSIVLPEWERRLGLPVNLTAFTQALTVGDIWAIVQKRLVGNEQLAIEASYATQRTFYQLRQALTSMGYERATLTPHTALVDLFPYHWRQRRGQWQAFTQRSTLPLPPLRVPIVLWLLLWLVATASVWKIAPDWKMVLLTGLAMTVVASSLSWLHLALPTTTLGQLTARLVDTQYRSLIHPSLIHNRSEFREVVLEGLVACMGESYLTTDDLRDGTRIRWRLG
jgi:hypothetical protein